MESIGAATTTRATRKPSDCSVIVFISTTRMHDAVPVRVGESWLKVDFFFFSETAGTHTEIVMAPTIAATEVLLGSPKRGLLRMFSLGLMKWNVNEK